MGVFADWMVEAAPRWLQRPTAAAFLRSIGALLDGVADTARAAVVARFPEGDPEGDTATVGISPLPPIPGAQDAIGEERGLPRIRIFASALVPPELNGPYGARLRKAWDDVALRGSPEGLRLILGYIADTMPAAWTTTVFDHGGWNPFLHWARAWILIQKPHPWVSDGVWSDPGSWGDAGTWGSSATGDQVANFRAILKPWCPPWARTDAVIHLSGGIWGEPGTWGDPGTWGGAAVTWPRLER